MKRTLLIFACALCAMGTWADGIPVLKVETADKINYFQLSEIDSIQFSPAADYMYVNFSDDKQTTFNSIDILQMTYGTMDEAKEVSLVWSESSVEVTNPMSDNGVAIDVNGTDVVITSVYPDEVTYNLSGTCPDGSLKIYSDYKYEFVLNGLTLTNTDGPAINSQSKKKGTIKMQKGTTNTLTDGATYAESEEDQKGCLFSEGQLVFKGKGTLNVVANCKHGIASDDYIEVEKGTINVTTTADAAKAFKANDYITVTAEEDDPVITITQSGKKVVEDGDVSYCAGMKADSTISIEGGVITINSSAEGGRGLNADLGIIIKGGTINCTMTGNGGEGYGDDERPGGGGPGGGGPGGGGPGGGGGGRWSAMADADTTSFTSPCIKTDGYVTISGGKINFTTSGIKGFGIKAYGVITMTGGELFVQTTGSSAEGIESKTQMDLSGGKIYAYSKQDDAINCGGAINFSGAWVYAVSDGNDAVDSNYGRSGAIAISGGVVVALSSKGSPEEGLDADSNSYIKISGGYVFSGGAAQGGGGMGGGSSSVGSATQGYCFTGSYTISKGTYYTVYNNTGDALFTIKAMTALSSSTNSLSLISAPALTKSSTNSIKSGTAAPTGSEAWDGYIYVGGTSSASTSVKSFTAK